MCRARYRRRFEAEILKELLKVGLCKGLEERHTRPGRSQEFNLLALYANRSHLAKGHVRMPA